MAILSKDEAKKIIDKVLSYSKADEMSVGLNGNRTGNIRYARNSVSTSGESDNLGLSVTAVFGKRSGTATINEFDDASLEKTVRRAEEIARLAPENPEYMPMLGPQTYLETGTYAESTAKINPEFRAQAAFDSIDPCKKKNLTAAGYMEDTTGFAAIGNSKGLFGYNKSTNVDFSITVRTADGTGSGYANPDVTDISKLSTKAATEIAMQKALASVNAKALEPGKYTVILEPTASVELLQNMMRSIDARSADEGRSFLSKKGGGTRLGEKLFDERVTIITDPMNAELPLSPFGGGGGGRFGGGGGEGIPQEKRTWIENGVVKNMAYSRFWAEKKGVKPVPGPSGFIMMGGNQSLADLIKSTDKGILVTRFWYIRAVDPQTQLYTGLTRDGTFYIENGQIKFPVKNFRFNESPIIMLNNVEALGKPVRAGGNLIPPMKIRDFTFTSLSDAV
ncbi:MULTISPECIES: TldD/PmbA family protein [unclassified Spirosoma]|uniref:TldD/PmbA family protein n=1 Tax=unclassified Spirosoma TaxID=2621999 RepID=UPI000967828A|nr:MULTISPECIES: TldD/PmbA family protein [unclassified Spirosoma]MBN8821149.1 TldD/PmbA family protein [Spirosoma sp.]OJW79219.1 MAG: peptidase C69 [Spirosoma sp. 48-14]